MFSFGFYNKRNVDSVRKINIFEKRIVLEVYMRIFVYFVVLCPAAELELVDGAAAAVVEHEPPEEHEAGSGAHHYAGTPSHPGLQQAGPLRPVLLLLAGRVLGPRSPEQYWSGEFKNSFQNCPFSYPCSILAISALSCPIPVVQVSVLIRYFYTDYGYPRASELTFRRLC